jgi:hypothetical protein
VTAGWGDNNGRRRASGLAHHFLAAVDIEGFSRLDASRQVRRQQELARVLDAAARRAGMDRAAWVREVRGDGELAVLPDGTDGPVLVARYPRELATALTKLNGEGASRARLRLRLALHHGTLAAGALGVAGNAPIEVSRLLDSDVLRRELARRPDQDLVLIVSERVYGDVVQTRFLGLDPAEFAAVTIGVKGQEYRGYIHRPLGEASARAASPARLQGAVRRRLPSSLTLLGPGGTALLRLAPSETPASSPEEPPRRVTGTVLVDGAMDRAVRLLRQLSPAGAGRGRGARPGPSGSSRPRRTRRLAGRSPG